jgi:hypothetical protein
MNQNRKQAQPTQGHQGQQRTDKEMPANDRNRSGEARNQGDRDKAEGSRDDQTSGGAQSTNMGSQERGAGTQGERNSGTSDPGKTGGISNRGMGAHDEQEDLPPRGSTGEGFPDQLER